MSKVRWAMSWGSVKRRRAVVGMAAMAAILAFGSQALAQEPQAARLVVRRNWRAPRRTRLRQ